MLGISSLLCETRNYGDSLRYSEEARHQQHGTHTGHGPVVVWSVTRTCNLNCIHCYSSSESKRYDGELSTAEALGVIDDLADFRVPVVLFSGGEPLARPDLLELAARAADRGIRVTISTNGTLITPEVARQLKEIGVSYVGVSFDGIGEVHDRFRRREGAFQAALTGVRNCLEVGQRVGLRFTINAHNFSNLEAIFDFIEQENIPRACFYHLVYSGRGSTMVEDDITHEQTRQALDLIISRVQDFHRRGLDKEVLTVDNHADGVYLYLKVKETDEAKAERILRRLRANGGNRSGIAICNIDHLGNVHPDQFTQNHTFGNVREKPLKEIWTRSDNPILLGLKDRRRLLKGRCAACRYLDACNGNFRARAEAVYGDFWGPDPACYLTDEEIGLRAPLAS